MDRITVNRSTCLSEVAKTHENIMVILATWPLDTPMRDLAQYHTFCYNTRLQNQQPAVNPYSSLNLVDKAEVA